MKLQIEDDTNKVTIEVDDEIVVITEIVDRLVVPALLALGYHPDSIKALINTEAL
jgi:hypothetical protein